jgi:hypothetical protein
LKGLSKLTDYCQFEHTWPIYEITALEGQLARILNVLEIPYDPKEVEERFEQAWESEDRFTDLVISHPEDKNIFLLYHIDFHTPDFDYLIIRGKKENKKRIQKVFVEEWYRTSEPKYPQGIDIDVYFSDKIETKRSMIGAIIQDKSLDLQWFGINEGESFSL